MPLSLDSPITEIGGVGTETAKLLENLDLKTVEDLLLHIPVRYEDYSKIVPIAIMKPGKITLKGRFENIESRYTKTRKHLTTADFTDESGKCQITWFSQPYRATDLNKQEEVYLSGELKIWRDRISIINPVYEPVSKFTKHTARIVAVYSLTKGLTSGRIRQLIYKARNLHIEDYLPGTIVENQKLMTFNECVKQLHFPKSIQDLELAIERWKFTELFDLVLSTQLYKKDQGSLKSYKTRINSSSLKGLTESLGFELTSAQRVAAWEIIQDMTDVQPMNRLLEGDVGSGKTVVAALGVRHALDNKLQAALIAPTEIVANQHFFEFKRILGKEVRVRLLTSSTTQRKKRLTKNGLASGEINVVVGTHAVLQPDVKFNKLGLVVFDEQHRFGVKQRQQLTGQDKTTPHFLSMTATPIPRTLALTVFSDLKLSIIDEMPPGRRPVETEVFTSSKRQYVYDQIEEQLSKGHQAYVVCPLIDESDKLGVASVEVEFKRIRDYFKKYHVDFLHGSIKTDEKNTKINNFVKNITNILVATTVVEVGVNVPNATIMLIEGAERFGLSQLHQLRGRVGRANHQAYCFALTSNANQSSERLNYFQSTTDGFRLAELDLKLRGSGQMFSTAQSGQFQFQYADITDPVMIKRTTDAAKQFVEQFDLVQYPSLERRIKKLRTQRHLN